MNSMYDILAKMKQLNENVDPVAFAALAPPKDKITFADKIAGAKKEVDEMLGDVAAEAMKKAVHGLANEKEGMPATVGGMATQAQSKLKEMAPNLIKPKDRIGYTGQDESGRTRMFSGTVLRLTSDNQGNEFAEVSWDPSPHISTAHPPGFMKIVGTEPGKWYPTHWMEKVTGNNESVDDMEEDGLGGLRKAAGVAKKVGKKVLNVIAPDDETLVKDLQKKVGVPQTGKVPGKAGSQQKTEEGNDFTAARLAAIKAGKPTFKLNGKVYRVTGDTSDERKQVDERDYDSRDDFDQHARPGDTVRTEKGTLTKTASGVRHERRHTDDDDSDDHDDTTPKRRGRPKGSKRALGAKGPGGKSKLLNKKPIKEISDELADKVYNARLAKYQSTRDALPDLEKNAQGKASVADLYKGTPTGAEHAATAAAAKGALGQGQAAQNTAAQKLNKNANQNVSRNYKQQMKTQQAKMPWHTPGPDAGEWNRLDARSKQVLARQPMREEGKDPEIEAAIKKLEGSGYTVTKKELDEKAVSKKQQKFMGMVHAAQKGEKAASPEVAKVAREMPKKAAKDFAATKHKGLPEKVKAKKDEGKEEVEETTAGSVATAPAAEAPKSKKGGMQFGKGVYESRLEEGYNQRLKAMLTEGMSINASQDENGQKSLSITATDEDAVKLSQILQLAGMQQATGYEEACPGCGQSPCGCESVEESLANAPDPQYAGTDTMINDLSGGLNGRKTTGQTTAPVINRDPVRQGVRGVADELKEQAETRLWDLYKRYERR